MILDAGAIEAGAGLQTDVCIVGSGAAGITLALELSRANLDVVLLTGGRARERSGDRDLYRGAIEPSGSHEPLEENRRRAFGGTTTAWGGRCVPLEPIDFQARAWMPESGWPIDYYTDLRPFFGRAMELCEAGPFSFDAEDTFSAARAPMIDAFDGPEIVTSRLERWSPPTNFAKRYKSAMLRSSRLRVLIGGHAIHIQLNPSRRSVDYVRASARPGHDFTVRARAHVLAAGGLENPRLLLSSNDVQNNGIGNANDLVGRYYMSHLLGVAETVRIADRGSRFRYGFERDSAGVYCRRRFALTDSAQSKRQIGNAVATLIRPPLSNAAHRDPLFSAAFLTKQYLDVMRQGGLTRRPPEWHTDSAVRREHWKVIAHTTPASALSTMRVVRQRYLAKRRLPMLLADPSALEHHLCYQTEHAPNRESRVSLSTQRDAFGLPRVAVHVAFSEVDVRTVVEFHRILSARLAATGTGSMPFDELGVRDQVAQDLKNFNSQAHHLGTTRMSDSPASGVVDANCNVHDLDDLFVIGGSVFPTGGHANPTLTIVALSARLAQHLKDKLVSTT